MSNKTTSNENSSSPGATFTPADFGKQLRDCRQAAGYSIEQVSLLTRISIPFIEALEAGNVAELPADVFARGFIRNMCKAYGADSKQFVADYERALHPPVVEAAEEPAAPVSPKKAAAVGAPPNPAKPKKVKAEKKVAAPKPAPVPKADIDPAASKPMLNRMQQVALVAGVLIIGVWFWARQQVDQPNVEEIVAESPATQTEDLPAVVGSTPLPGSEETVASEEQLPAVDAPAEEVVAVPPPIEEAPVAAVQPPVPAVTPVQPPVQEPATVVLEAEKPAAGAPAGNGEQVIEIVVTRPVMLRMSIDGKSAVSQELQPQTYTYKFTDNAELLVFNAAAVSVSFNGRSLGSLGSEGRRRRLSFAAAPDKDKAKL